MNQHQPINMFMKKYCVLFILLCVTFFVGNAQQFEVKKLANETIELSLRLQNYERITKTVNGINYEDFSGLKSIVMMQKNATEQFLYVCAHELNRKLGFTCWWMETHSNYNTQMISLC
jgi:hypothetical protein